MNLKEILAVPGKKGVYKMVSHGKKAIIAESLLDGSRMPVFTSTRTTTLADIRIFTENEDMPLKDVFKRIFEIENGNKAIDAYAAKPSEIEDYMAKVLPEYDKDRVHLSDMKKLFFWYNQLVEHNILSFEEEVEEETTEAVED
jgi:hypothetical protein